MPPRPRAPARDLTPGDHDVPPFSLGGQDQYQFSPDGREIAFTSNLDEAQATSTNSDVFTLNLGGANLHPVNLTAANHGSDSTPLYSPNGKYIAIRSQFRAGYESDRFRLQLIERATGKTINLTENFDHWVESVAWAPDSSKLYFTSEDTGETPIYSIAVPGGQPMEIIRGSNDAPTPTPDGKTLIFARSSVRFPTELFTIPTAAPGGVPAPPTAQHSKAQAKAPHAVYSEKDEAVSFSAARQLTHMNDARLAHIQMQPIEWFWFTGAEKKQVAGIPRQAARLRSIQEISGQVPHPRRTARCVGRRLELPLESQSLRRLRLRRRHDQSARLHRLRPAVHRRYKRRLGWPSL